MHFSINRNRPPTGDGMARLSDTPSRGARSRPKAKSIPSLSRNRPFTGDEMARLSETPPRGARSRPKAKCILLKKHSSIDGNRPLTGDGIARLSLQQNPGGTSERPRARLSDEEAHLARLPTRGYASGKTDAARGLARHACAEVGRGERAGLVGGHAAG